MTGFLNTPVGSNLDFKAAWITDIHHKVSNPTYDANYPRFISSLLASPVTKVFNSGDTGDALGQVSQSIAMRDAIWGQFGSSNYHVARGNHDGAISGPDLGMPGNYYTEDLGSRWKLITLYSQDGGNYVFGATQMAWLANELATSTNKFIVIMSHVPIMAQGCLNYYLLQSNASKATALNNCNVDTMAEMTACLDLLAIYPNVKLWLSGHEHTQDIAIVNGVTYINGGAVAGQFWTSVDSNKVGGMFKPNYNKLFFNKDGTHSHSYVFY